MFSDHLLLKQCNPFLWSYLEYLALGTAGIYQQYLASVRENKPIWFSCVEKASQKYLVIHSVKISTDSNTLSKSYHGKDLASRSQFNTTNVISVQCLRLDSVDLMSYSNLMLTAY